MHFSLECMPFVGLFIQILVDMAHNFNEDTCRTCASARGTVSLFSIHDGLKLCDIIMTFTAIQINVEDPLPSKVCENCNLELLRISKFKQTCEQSEQKLRGLSLSKIFECNIISKTNGKRKRTNKNSRDKISKLGKHVNNLLKIKKDIQKTNGQLVQDLSDDDCDMDVSLAILSSNISNGQTDSTTLNNQNNVKNGACNKPVKPPTARKARKEKNNKIMEEPVVEAEKMEDGKDRQTLGDLYLRDTFSELQSIPLPQKKKRRLKKYVCETCGYAANDRSSLRVHIRIHSGERPFRCDDCGKTFAIRANLSAHARTHSGERRFVCEACGRALASAAALRGHARTHSGERPYACAVCPRAFALASNLRKHSRTHTGERNHICTVCRKSFTTSSELHGHARTHSGERPYACSACPRAFALSSNLRQHNRTHSRLRPHRCETCGQDFSCKTALRSHARTHAATRAHACGACGARFAHAGALAAHAPVHTGSRDHICPVCGKRYARKSSLAVHNKKHKQPADAVASGEQEAPLSTESSAGKSQEKTNGEKTVVEGSQAATFINAAETISISATPVHGHILKTATGLSISGQLVAPGVLQIQPDQGVKLLHGIPINVSTLLPINLVPVSIMPG